MESKTCKSGYKKAVVQHADGTVSIRCKRLPNKKVKLTPAQKLAIAKRRGKKLK